MTRHNNGQSPTGEAGPQQHPGDLAHERASRSLCGTRCQFVVAERLSELQHRFNVSGLTVFDLRVLPD